MMLANNDDRTIVGFLLAEVVCDEVLQYTVPT
jgi:hypothetical protein